jgi:acetyl-CoA carboxylase carboxyltransferase component
LFVFKSGQIPAMLVDTATKNQEWNPEKKLSDKKNEKKKSEKKNENEKNLSEKKSEKSEISIDDIIDKDDVKDKVITNAKLPVEKPITSGKVEKTVDSMVENKAVQGTCMHMYYIYIHMCLHIYA